jgi:hypothetical protein
VGWDAGTLCNGSYTLHSEMYQVGRLLLESVELSEGGRCFANKLVAKEFTLGQALGDQYMGGLNR